jgi:hypothetical protein
MTLRENDPRLTAYALGELDEAERREVEALLADDEQARQAVEEIRHLAGMLTDELAAEPAPKLTGKQRQGVLAASATKPARRIRLWAALAAAAAILIVAGAAFYYITPGPEYADPAGDGTGQPIGKGGGEKPTGVEGPDDNTPEYYGTPEPRDGRDESEDKGVELKLALPERQFRGTPENLKSGNLPPKSAKPASKVILVPRGTKNVARGKTVTGSDEFPTIGELEQVTDGDKEGMEGSFVEMGPGLQWVQIDLKQRFAVHAIAVWHYHAEACVMRDVIVQISDDMDFIENVRTVFNNDHDNSAGLGVGKQYEWVETNEAKVIETKGVEARYVRLYSSGGTSSDGNPYTEVEVFATPAEGDKATEPPKPKAPPEDKVASKKVVLKIELPGPTTIVTPKNLRSGNLPKTLPGSRGPFLVAKGTKLLSRDKKVTASDDEPIIGELEQVTDGDKEGMDGSWVELGPGLQWVQIDLDEVAEIAAIVVWHCHLEPAVFRDVVVQVADDPDFVTNVRTVFNNDHDNSAGLGVGKQFEWIEMCEGKLIDTKGIKARYLRLYSSGSTSSDQNPYTEVEVFGKVAE